MPIPPHLRKRRTNPLAGQVLGVLVRQAEREPTPLKLTEPRRKLMEGIGRGEVWPGKGRYAVDGLGRPGYRWHHGNGDSETVTMRIHELIQARWAVKGETHLELTEAGQAALGKADEEGAR